MDTGQYWVFLFIALSVGWALGFYAKPRTKTVNNTYQSPQDIKHRLQLLFDSYSDESIDRFVNSLDVTPETLNTHISIGKHFRIQGEVEKAILIHQNLMAHPELPDLASETIIYELAKDYKSVGLFDRAEALLLQLGHSRTFGFKSLKLLLDVYEHEKDWDEAASKGQELDLKKYPDIALRVAQYYCEIAEDKQRNRQILEVRRMYKKAISIHKGCIRALIGLAQLDIDQKEFSSALHYLKQVARLSPENIVLIIPMLLECTIASDTFAPHQHYLKKLYKETGQIPVLLAVVESMVTQGEVEQACIYLEDHLCQTPNLFALNQFFKQCLLEVSSECKSKENTVRSRHILSGNMQHVIARVIEQEVSQKPLFRCYQCGFSGGQHHWLCPSCKGWQTTRPFVEYDSSLDTDN